MSIEEHAPIIHLKCSPRGVDYHAIGAHVECGSAGNTTQETVEKIFELLQGGMLGQGEVVIVTSLQYTLAKSDATVLPPRDLVEIADGVQERARLEGLPQSIACRCNPWSP